MLEKEEWLEVTYFWGYCREVIGDIFKFKVEMEMECL